MSNSAAPRGARILATEAEGDCLSRLSSPRDDSPAFSLDVRLSAMSCAALSNSPDIDML
jgi:hypothetical protein